MNEFQLVILQLSLLGITLSVLVASFIIGTAINNLAKAIEDKNNESNTNEH